MIRDFAAEDQAVVRDLVLAGLEDRWGDAYDASHNPDLDDLNANYVAHGAEVVVLEAGGEIVATGILLSDGRDRGRIVRMSVDRCHRRQGHGRRIVEELIRRARHRGMVEVIVLTDTPWTSAVALYRSCGFDEVGRDDTDTHFAMLL